MNSHNAIFDFLEIELAFDFANFEGGGNHAYLDRYTGRTLFVSDFGDSDELPDDSDDSERLVSLPDSRDLNLGSQLAVDFTSETAPSLLDDVCIAFNGRGAYRKFKSLLDAHGLLESWYKYEADAERHALRRWCDDNNIRYSIATPSDDG